MYGTEFLQPDVGAPDPSLLSTLCFLIGLQTLQPAIACCLSPNLSMPDLAQSLASLLAICLSEGRQTALWTSFISVRTAQTSGLPNEYVLFTVFVALQTDPTSLSSDSSFFLSFPTYLLSGLFIWLHQTFFPLPFHLSYGSHHFLPFLYFAYFFFNSS